jgi:type VI secretion system protein ImpL
MLSFLTKRLVLEIVGIILLTLLIWFAGPYFAFADFRPLAPEWARWLTIALVVAIWTAIKLLQIVKAALASSKLASAVVAQPDPAPSTDEAQLRERFEEAIGALKANRGRNYSLYSEPWYVIIGAPGSGKTTLLQNSGLQFPLAQRFGRDAVRGVGGTRNCDWWFTDEAIFLDTAGRFTTQDSDPGSDARGWREFLALLKKYRSRRPLNGIILTVSVGDLLTLTAPGRDAQIAATRRRLDELKRELGIRLPIYLLVTKCDLMAGFTEYFDDQSAEERKQVWGVTVPYEQTLNGRAPELFGDEFDRLVARLNERMWQRLEDEQEARRRAKIFSFPQQLAALKDVLGQFVTEVFAGTRMDARALLRGVYLTSGTQEGTPIDRLLGSVGRAFAFEPQELPHGAFGRGKAYFIERLLKEVILPERGLAGVNRRLELQIAGAQLVIYVGLAIIALFLVAAVTVSYAANRGYLESVRSELGHVDSTELHAGAPIEQVAARLDQVARVADAADRYHDGAPWSMRWGLFAGSSIGQAGEDAYSRLLNGLLLPRIAALFRQRLETPGLEPYMVYQYLKAYLILGGKGSIDKEHLKGLARAEWKEALPSNPDLVAALAAHSDRLFDRADSLRSISVDENAVAQARATLRTATIERLVYGELKWSYDEDTEHALRLDNAAGLGLGRALTRRSGLSWSTPMSALYTKKVFGEVTGLTGTVQLVTRFSRESWVIQDRGELSLEPLQLRAKVLRLYEQDYIRQWDQVVNDLQLPSMKNFGQMKDVLATLASREGSPLRGLLQVIDENTYLVKPEDAAAPSMMDKMRQAAQSGYHKLFGGSAEKEVKPGTEVTAHFAPLHALVSGAPGQAHIDAVLEKIDQVAKGISACGPGIGQQSAEECVKRDPTPVKALSQEAKTLPAGVGPLVDTIATTVDRAGVHELARDLVERYDEEVLHDCELIIGTRYPFNPGSGEDVPLEDFGHLLGYGGVFDNFYKKHLADLVDTRTRPWRWKSSESGALPAPESMLRRFEAADAIRRVYFHSGSDKPEFRFELAPAALDPSATRVELSVDGQAIEYRHEAIRATAAKWPGAPTGSAWIEFEERGGGHPSKRYEGPWAWFRLIDQGRPQAEQGARYRLSYGFGGHTAGFTLFADSLFNPLEKTDLQRFACRF